MSADQKLRVGVLFGGRSGEHEVSLMSARSVLAVLDPAKYEVTQIGITHDGLWVSGENVLDSLQSEQVNDLLPAAQLPDPTRGPGGLLEGNRFPDMIFQSTRHLAGMALWEPGDGKPGCRRRCAGSAGHG
jgi:D-alanine-D-alanine ligase-like ATP-grasp enzyme